MKDYASMTVNDLKALAAEQGVTISTKARKSEIISALESAQIEDAPEAPTLEDAPEAPEYLPAPSYPINEILSAYNLGAITYDPEGHAYLTDTELDAIVLGIIESRVYALTNAHVTQGHADLALTVTKAGNVAYVLPINAHGTRVAPADLFGSPAEAPVMYVPADSGALERNQYKAFTVSGKPYAVKADKEGKPIKAKMPLRRYIQKLAGGCIAYHLYEALHMPIVDWLKPRNLAFRVLPARDLEIS